MKYLKFTGAILIVVILLFLFVVKFSAVEARFKCTGKETINGISSDSTIYMKLNEYRWWVYLWSKSDGDVWLEIPKRTVIYSGNLKENGHEIQIYNGLYDDEIKLIGYFSKLSKSLSIKEPSYTILKPTYSFEGSCEAIE